MFILFLWQHYYILCSDFGDWAEGDSSALERASDVGELILVLTLWREKKY